MNGAAATPKGAGAARGGGHLRPSRGRHHAHLRRPLRLASIRHILVRHEQGAVHAATAYARASGRVGVVHGHLGPRGA
jgi:thiamine pyrophosphate-dependent acetolactate synthase large subunit-like protein